MTIHLVKLCVGADTIDDLEAWIAECRAEALAAGRRYEQIHRTRSTPKRADEIVTGGGSLYWVVRGVIRVRQRIVEIRAAEGQPACDIVLAPELVRTVPKPQRPFQGWRYLEPAAAPADIGPVADAGDDAIRSALAELCLL